MTIVCIISGLWIGVVSAFVVAMGLQAWETRRPMFRGATWSDVLLRVMGCVLVVNALLYVLIRRGR